MNQGRVPEGWEEKFIGDTLKIKHGKDQKQVECKNGIYPILGSGGQIGCSKLALYGKESVLIGRKGTINKPQYIDTPFWTIDTLFYSDIKKVYEPKFIYYKFCAINWLKYNEASGVPSLNSKTIENIRIILPKDKKEQKKISNILSAIDKNIEKTIETIEKYKKIKKGLMNDLLTGKIRIKDGKWVEETEFKYVEGVGDIPKEWDVDILDKLTKEKIKDGTHSTPNYLERGIPFLRVTDIQNKEIDLESIKYISIKEHEELIKRTKPEIGDILYSKNGTIGIAKIIDWNWEFSIFVSLALIKPNKNKINTKFLETILNSFIAEKQIKFRAKQGTVTNLHLEEIREFLIPYPSIVEQQKISNILSKQNQLIEKEEQYLQKLQKLKNGLMNDLLTGKKRVKMENPLKKVKT